MSDANLVVTRKVGRHVNLIRIGGRVEQPCWTVQKTDPTSFPNSFR